MTINAAVKQPVIAVIGLGYVGLPLAVAFAGKHSVIGYDIDSVRVLELIEGRDRTLEVDRAELHSLTRLKFTCEPSDMRYANVFIITAPTPIDLHKNPDLTAVLSASREVAKWLHHGDVVIYESTVYPGVTEDECVPVLESGSNLRFNEHFFVGYSPERINPGDKEHRLSSIVKVTSGSTSESALFVDSLYREVVEAGTHLAPSIRVAEAAKVIENTQRDVNIALVNELSMLFDRMGIDTHSVLEAAGTKWNFLPFRPGLVGGHCIGVDPYYLTFKAKEVGHNPELILAGRRINDSMGSYVAAQLVKSMAKAGLTARRVLVLGLSFKENTPDLRNTRVIDIINELREYGLVVDVYDPWVDAIAAKAEYGIDLLQELQPRLYDGVLIAVAHREFSAMSSRGLRVLGRPEGCIIYDVKQTLRPGDSDLKL